MIHPPLPASQVNILARAQRAWSAAYAGSPAETYMLGRGIPTDFATRFGMGYVADGTEHPQFPGFEGRLTLPNFNRGGVVVGMKARDLTGNSKAKYLNFAGVTGRLFNLFALNLAEELVVICEGEIDALSVCSLGIPAIGVPGVEGWKDHHVRLLEQFDKIVLVRDNDGEDESGDRKASKGGILVSTIRKALPSAVVVSPVGKDANEDLAAGRGEELRDKIWKAVS